LRFCSSAKIKDTFLFYSPLNNLLSEAKKAWQTRCSKAEIVKLVRSVLPGAYSTLLKDIELGIDIAENIVMTFEIPNCGGKYISFPFDTSKLANKKNIE